MFALLKQETFFVIHSSLSFVIIINHSQGLLVLIGVDLIQIDSIAPSSSHLFHNCFVPLLDANHEVKSDEFWDYEQQVDLEAFSCNEFYSILSKQSRDVTSSIARQKDQVNYLIRVTCGKFYCIYCVRYELRPERDVTRDHFQQELAI